MDREIFMPPEAYFARPRAKTIIARVVMNGCTPNRAVTNPDAPPQSPPMSKLTATTTTDGQAQ